MNPELALIESREAAGKLKAERLATILRAPFRPDELEWRIVSSNREKTSGIPYPYVSARAVHARLDEAFGNLGWSFEVRPTEAVDYRIEEWDEELKRKVPKLVKRRTWIGRLVIHLPEAGGLTTRHLIREDVAEETDVEAGKGAVSGSMKRCAVTLGAGAYLYRLPETWVPMFTRKDPRWSDEAVYAGKGKDGSLYFHPPQLPPWALPASVLGLRPDKLSAGTANIEAVEASLMPQAETKPTEAPAPAPQPSPAPEQAQVAQQERPWAKHPNGHILPADLSATVNIRGQMVPEWFTLKHGQPGKSPLEGFHIDRPLADLTWGELAEDRVDGPAWGRLLWELTLPPTSTDRDGRPLKPHIREKWKLDHENRSSYAMGVLLWIQAREQGRATETKRFPGEPREPSGQSDADSLPAEAEDQLAESYEHELF